MEDIAHHSLVSDLGLGNWIEFEIAQFLLHDLKRLIDEVAGNDDLRVGRGLGGLVGAGEEPGEQTGQGEHEDASGDVPGGAVGLVVVGGSGGRRASRWSLLLGDHGVVADPGRLVSNDFDRLARLHGGGRGRADDLGSASGRDRCVERGGRNRHNGCSRARCGSHGQAVTEALEVGA